MIDYSIVVPVYNSEKALPKLYSGLNKVMNELNSSFEVIFVEDCGLDNSWEVIKDIKSKNEETVRAVRLNRILVNIMPQCVALFLQREKE